MAYGSATEEIALHGRPGQETALTIATVVTICAYLLPEQLE